MRDCHHMAMNPTTSSPLPVFRRREFDGVSLDERRLRRGVNSGESVRITSGSFADGETWRNLRPLDQHVARVIEAGERARGTIVATHFSAAALWGIDQITTWPDLVDVRVPHTSGGRSSGLFRRRAIGVNVPVTVWGRHLITTPAQTVVDIASVSSHLHGVVAMDQARWARRAGGALTDSAEISAAIEGLATARARARASAALNASTDLADSVRESQSRILIVQLGFPEPSLQHPFMLRGGREARSDFFWENDDHIGEFDGVGKYFDPAFTHGRTPEQVLIAEKDRGDELRRMARGFSRWRTPALTDPRILYDILTGDGLRSRFTRPVAGRVWG